MRRTRRPLAALALVALIGAGCSNSSAEQGDTNGNDQGADQGKGMKFAQCMRDNGVSEFPDPDASGELTIDGIVNGSSLDTSAPAWKQAIAACRELQPPGFTGRKRSAQEQDGALAFARCIREHGVEDFPDPTPGEPLVDTRRIPSAGAPGGMDVLNAAMQSCGDAAAAAGVER
jgi:hypothetical protein